MVYAHPLCQAFMWAALDLFSYKRLFYRLFYTRVLQVEDLWTSRLHVAVWEQDQGLLSSNTLIGEAYIAPAGE